MTKRTILVAGTMAFDTIETPQGKREKILGGSANYFSLIASNFTKLELSAIVGQDFPKDYMDFLNNRGVGTANVEYVDGKTFHWFGKYSGAMNEAKTTDTHLNVLNDYDPKMNNVAKEAEVLFLANVDPPKQYKAIKEAVGAKIVICDTMNFWIENKLEDLKKVFTKVDILIINEHEARMLSHETSIVKAVKKVAEMGPKTIIIKRGEYGAFVYREGENLFYIPAYPVEDIVDPTGAGDSFAGGFTGYLSTVEDMHSFKEIKKAMLYGTVSASFTVEGFGIESAKKVTKQDIDKRYNEFIELLKFD